MIIAADADRGGVDCRVHDVLQELGRAFAYLGPPEQKGWGRAAHVLLRYRPFTLSFNTMEDIPNINDKYVVPGSMGLDCTVYAAGQPLQDLKEESSAAAPIGDVGDAEGEVSSRLVAVPVTRVRAKESKGGSKGKKAAAKDVAPKPPLAPKLTFDLSSFILEAKSVPAVAGVGDDDVVQISSGEGATHKRPGEESAETKKKKKKKKLVGNLTFW